MDTSPEESGGEAVIERAILDAYPGCEPVAFGLDNLTASKFALAGCFAIRVEEPTPHWLLVSRGFTELDEKVEEDPDVSGWGFELTCRVPARTDEADFGWVLDWMQGIADYLVKSGTFLAPFHNMPVMEPRNPDDLCALLFVEDVTLRSTRSANGEIQFLQMVGLTRGEHDALKRWDGRAFVELVRQRNPLLVTDAERKTYANDPDFLRAVTEGRERDGSSTGILPGVSVLWFKEANELQIHLRTDVVAIVKRAMGDRLRHGYPLILLGDRRAKENEDGSKVLHTQTTVVLSPEAGTSEVEETNGSKTAVLRFQPAAMAQVAELLSETPGSYLLPALPGVRFVVATRERFADPHYPW
jgi:suppressor of fused-like protein